MYVVWRTTGNKASDFSIDTKLTMEVERYDLRFARTEDAVHIERESQRRLLQALADRYPSRVPIKEPGFDKESLIFNLAYLGELDLVRCKFIRLESGELDLVNAPCITARGLDFLKADGGFTAILGVVTVKLHADTIRDLLTTKIQAASIAPEEKADLLAKLKNLPGTALEKLTEKLVELGVDHAPNAFDSLQQLLATAPA